MPDNPEQFYETPIEFVRHAMRVFYNTYTLFAIGGRQICYLDAGAGNGIWGKVVREMQPDVHIIGCELRTVDANPAYNEWHQRSFIHQPHWYDECVDIAVGNPPFWCINEWILAEQAALRPSGALWILAPLNILCGEARHQLLYTKWKPVDVYPIPQRMSFYNNGRTDAREYAMFYFRKGYNPLYTRVHYGEMSWYESKAPLSLKGRQKRVKKSSSVEGTQLELAGVENVGD